FPELQGVMGRHYALHASESPAVAAAIEQHWWPKGQGAALPASPEAALIAMADRVDTLVGCFATGLVPTGNADPPGLRRAAIAVLAIMLDRGPGGAHCARRWPANTRSLVDSAANIYRGPREVEDLAVSQDAIDQLHEFFRMRLRGLLVDDEALDPQAVDV